ncbi:MAG: phosphate acyltransferase, partial [Anaerolineaceae bacterium]|nr:phosphate acyltransferase [Anaerolineaceae bacterium]
YAEKMRGITNPKVGLLNNGSEPGKGNELAKAAYTLLEATDKINFIGNVEAKDVLGGKADVVVTDGFTGNMLLKTSEATAKLMTGILKEGLMSSFTGKIAGLLAKPVFKTLKAKLDPNEIGAAPLLGIDGLSFVGHGGSNSTALVNGMKLAKTAAEMDLISLIRDAIQSQLS